MVYVFVGLVLIKMPGEQEMIGGETLEPQLNLMEKMDRWGVPEGVFELSV